MNERDRSGATQSTASPRSEAAGGNFGGSDGLTDANASTIVIHPTVEDNYWAKWYIAAPYVTTGATYQLYRPAYRYGWESFPKYAGRKFDEVESELQRGWDAFKGNSSLTWEKAKAATRDAWHRVERAASQKY